jgi:hypothetical protein
MNRYRSMCAWREMYSSAGGEKREDPVCVERQIIDAKSAEQEIGFGFHHPESNLLDEKIYV